MRQWARRGSRPRQPADQRYESAYLFGAICPARGTGAALAMPYADSEAMQLHLVEVSSRVRRGAHAVLLLDRAGWHTTRRLVVPKNITLVFLPSRAPELNPVENIWQYLRQNWLSNRVFETYEAIIEAACEAWRSLLAEPTTITSIGHRGWAHVGQEKSRQLVLCARSADHVGYPCCSMCRRCRWPRGRSARRNDRPGATGASYRDSAHERHSAKAGTDHEPWRVLLHVDEAQGATKSWPCSCCRQAPPRRIMDEDVNAKLTAAWRAAVARLIEAGYEPGDVYATMIKVGLSFAEDQANDNPEPSTEVRPGTERPRVPVRER